MTVDARTLKAPPGSLKELLTVAIPLILSSGSLTLMYVVDRIFLTWHSKESLAAAMPSSMVQWGLLSVAIGAAQYVNTFVAQYEGAGQPRRVAAAVWQGVYFATLAGILGNLCVGLAGPIFALIGHSPTVQQLEVEYFQVLSWGSVPYIVSLVLASFFSGRGQTMIVMWVNLACSVINIALDPLLIFAWGPFPGWGITGAGIATVIAEWAMMFIYIAVLVRSPEWRTYAVWAERRFDRELFGRLVRFGLPGGLQLFMDVGCFTLFILLIGWIDETSLAATNLAFNLNTLAFLPMLGLGTAVSIIVGNRIGEGRPELAVRTTWKAFWLSAAFMSMFAVIYLTLPDLILAPYAAGVKAEEFAPLRTLVTQLLWFVAIYSLFDAMCIIFGSAVRGAGDTRFAMLFSIIAGWALMVIPTFVGIKYYGAGLDFAWWICTVYVMVLGLGYLARFQHGAWKSMKVIESVPPGAVPTHATLEPEREAAEPSLTSVP